MLIPHNEKNFNPVRNLITTNLNELSKFQVNKNRSYSQLRKGKLTAHYKEANFGYVQVFRESLNVGARIEAAPIESFIPFASILPSSGKYRFCGYEGRNNALVKAGGGIWDICYQDKLDYLCTAFNREYFYESYEALTGKTMPYEHSKSQITQTSIKAITNYSYSANYFLEQAHQCHDIFQQRHVVNLICSQLVQLTIDALVVPSNVRPIIKAQSKRIMGTRRVIDYLQAHKQHLPDMQTLCKVANLCERSLEYGFKEYLGMTPTRYIRIIRLNGVRFELLNCGNQKISVSKVAINWGFLELGRFAGEYKQLFDELPSHTLRRARC